MSWQVVFLEGQHYFSISPIIRTDAIASPPSDSDLPAFQVPCREVVSIIGVPRELLAFGFEEAAHVFGPSSHAFGFLQGHCVLGEDHERLLADRNMSEDGV